MLKYLFIGVFILSQFILSAQCTQDTLYIGQDTTLCSGQSIQLKASPGYMNYSWNTGSTNSSINISTAGQYICDVKIIDSTNILINGNFDFGNVLFTSNYTYGTGGSWGLLSNSGQYAISTNASLTHNNFAGCTDHTSGTGNFMIVNGSSIPNQHIWCTQIPVLPTTDYIFSAWFTSVISSNPATLNFTINGSSIGPLVNVNSTTCQWQNFFSTWTSGGTQITANICITNQNTNGSGNDFGIDDIYFAQLCDFTDTVNVKVNDYPQFSLGNDTTLCLGDSLHLTVIGDSISTYLWHDSTTISTFSSGDSDSIWLEVSNAHCRTTDSLILYVYDYPQIDLGIDTLICNGAQLTLDATWGNTLYHWQDGSALPTFNITSTGLYWVEVDNHNCKSTDSIHVTISQGPNPNLGPDKYICMGDFTLLDPGVWDQYLWSNGSSSSQINVSPINQQNYKVVVWDQDGCKDSTEVEVYPIENPIPDITSSTDTLCLGRDVILEASGGDFYLWDNGYSTQQIILSPKRSEIYNVQISNSSNGTDCIADTSIFVFVKDCNSLFMPNAFTPNNDGLNDEYGPKGEFELELYEFFVYDRLGFLVFYTKDVFKHWNGKNRKGEKLPDGVYTYLINVKEPIRETYQLYGTVHLLR